MSALKERGSYNFFNKIM